MINIPIFRAKKINSDKYVEGFYKNVLYFKDKHIITSLVNISGVENNIQKTNLWDYKNYEIDPTTLAIHFPDMLDIQGTKIFASLSEDGKGGSLVVSKSYPFYGDAPEIHTSSGKCEELNYKGLICFSSNGCYLDYIKVSDRVRGCAIGGVIEEFNKYKVIGIQDENRLS